MKLKRVILIFIVIGLFFSVRADEGMWLPHQMKDLNLKELGLRMDPEDLYKKDGTGLMSAVVHLGGGTGEFVSPKGLILTNHHVAYGAIQRASSKEKDYLTHGFLAETIKEEIPAPGYIADVLLGYQEVTAEVLSAVRPNMSYKDKYKAIEKRKKTIIARAERKGKDIRCTLREMYSGNQYYLFTFKRLNDLRLVYAPPSAIGHVGGDVDTWLWPRHTGDFTCIRAYVSPDGSAADYSPANVPYSPKAFLRVSPQGARPGDFTFVMGYPGRTFRNQTLAELQYDIRQLAKRKDFYEEVAAFFEKAEKDDREIQIKYASKVRGLNNSIKNREAKLKGMKAVGILDQKRAQMAEFSRQQQGTILTEIAAFMEKYGDFREKQDRLSNIVDRRLGSAVISLGYTIYRVAVEGQKSDMERDPRYQQRNLPLIKMRMQLAERGYHPEVERAYIKYQFKKMLDTPVEAVPAAFKELLSKKSAAAVDEYVDHLFDHTQLMNPEARQKMLGMNLRRLRQLKDPIIELAANLEKELQTLREEEKAIDQEYADLKKAYIGAWLKMKGGILAPDANGTIRFTYGPVEGYRPRDAVYFTPITTLTGVIEKEQEEFPFRVPEKLKELYQKKDYGPYADSQTGKMPVCFLNTTNVTGGSSGSPALNARGEQVGIVFDMTYESVIGDYYIVPELQRTIMVDIRYVLFVTHKFAGALHIIRELGL